MSESTKPSPQNTISKRAPTKPGIAGAKLSKPSVGSKPNVNGKPSRPASPTPLQAAAAEPSEPSLWDMINPGQMAKVAGGIAMVAGAAVALATDTVEDLGEKLEDLGEKLVEEILEDDSDGR